MSAIRKSYAKPTTFTSKMYVLNVMKLLVKMIPRFKLCVSASCKKKKMPLIVNVRDPRQNYMSNTSGWKHSFKMNASVGKRTSSQKIQESNPC